jgi:hypothetical protein
VSPFRPSFPPPLGVFSQLPTTHCSLSTLLQLSPLSTAFTPNRLLTPLSTAFTQTTGGGGYLCVNSALSAPARPTGGPLRYHFARRFFALFSRNCFALSSVRTLVFSCQRVVHPCALGSCKDGAVDFRFWRGHRNRKKREGLTPFRINTCKSVSKQKTLSTCRMNTYAKPRGRGVPHDGEMNPPLQHKHAQLAQRDEALQYVALPGYNRGPRRHPGADFAIQLGALTHEHD